MKHLLSAFLILFFTIPVLGQPKTAKDYGFTHIRFKYKSDTVDILIKSRKGEEAFRKPLFFFCQGSLPQPLIKTDEHGAYGVFTFNPDSLSIPYHLVIVGKPYIPLIKDVKSLAPDYTYKGSNGKFPKEYSDRNLLDYYVRRNIAIIKFLQKQPWVSDRQLVLAGHSEGSIVAAKMASVSHLATQLIYSGGNPMGRILNVIEQNRAIETDSLRYAESVINYWQHVVKNKTNMESSQGDTDKATYEFSEPAMEYLEKLKIPVLVSYGTKDWCSPFNDLLRVDVIRKGKTNFRFNPYIGTEHNYFPLTKDNKPDYEIFNWDRVANDWLKWLKEQSL